MPELKDTTFRFVAASDLACHYQKLNSESHDVAIRQSVTSFIRNMERVKQTIESPMKLVGMLSWMHHRLGKAEQQLQDVEPSDKAQLTSTAILLLAEAMSLLVGKDLWTIGSDLGKALVDLSVSHDTDGAKLGVESLLSAMVIGSWTAFEAIADDLWVQCLNGRPLLGFVALDAGPLAADDEDVSRMKRNKRVPIPLRMFHNSNFNIASNMGTLLREQREFRFDSREKAEEAYFKVFPLNCTF